MANESSKKNIPISEDDLLVAATLIKDADACRNIEFRREHCKIRSYNFYNHIGFKIVLRLCIWIHLLLALCEQPAVDVLAMPYWATMIIEAVCLVFFALRLAHGCHFQESSYFWRDRKNITILVTIILTVADMICYYIWLNVGSSLTGHEPIRWSRPLRPFFIMNVPEGRQGTLVSDGKPYFQDYWDSYWDLYVLVTTANNPDVKMPAYDASRWYVTVFIIYMLINLYVIMNIVLAVIYNSYKRHLKNEVKSTIRHKHHLLGDAFDLLKTTILDRYVITKETFHDVMAKVDSKKTASQVDLLFKVLNRTSDDCIEKEDFIKLADLLAISLDVVKEDSTFCVRRCPSCYQSKTNQIIIMAISTRYFRWFFDFLIFVNAVCIGLKIDSAEWYFLPAFTFEIVVQLYAQGPVKYFKVLWNSFDFLVISAALIATLVNSVINKDTSNLDILDLIMILRILRLVRIATINHRFRIVLTTIINIGPSIVTYGCIILMVFYVYAIIGMELFHSRISYYGYDNETDPRQKCCGNPALNGSRFAENRYCSNNFNNLPHSFAFLFDLLIVNQWHVLAEGYVLVTHKAARLYFISFHITNVVILLNIFTAFVIEAFLLQYTSSKGQLESVVERRIKDLGLDVGQSKLGQVYQKQDKQELVENIEIQDISVGDDVNESPDRETTPGCAKNSDDATGTGLRFSVKTDGCKRLEALLQLMFEDELNDDEKGIKQRTLHGQNQLTNDNN